MSKPIKRLELEFIQSNVARYDYTVKINIIREPGYVGYVNLLDLNKFIIDEDDAYKLYETRYFMHYISNSVYISEDIYMGGLDIYSIAKDKANMKVDTYNLKDLDYFLDLTANKTDILAYILRYEYEGQQYSTPLVLSYPPIPIDTLSDKYIRACITKQNYRHRGPNESRKYDVPNQEITDDTRYLDETYENMVNDMESNILNMDTAFNSLYNIIERAKYINNIKNG